MIWKIGIPDNCSTEFIRKFFSYVHLEKGRSVTAALQNKGIHSQGSYCEY